MKPLALNRVRITDGFWADYVKLVRNTVIPHQYHLLNDEVQGVEPSCAIRNFRIAAGLEEGKHGGYVFQDSDLYKWIEAVGYALQTEADAYLEERTDKIIGYIEKAQMQDGYVNTYYILNDIHLRFTNLTDCHELYCLGHMIEAAIAYEEGTGKTTLLEVACRFADLVCRLFGREEGQMQGYPGHEEVELALVKLYDKVGERRYLELAKFFIDARGTDPNFFLAEWEKRGRTRHRLWRGKPELEYNQAHKPVREQEVAVGHAVRAVYLYTGMSLVAQRTADRNLMEASRRLWNDIVNRQMYITGSIGQTSIGEAFTFAYDLPNDVNYSETCASIGLIFFAQSLQEDQVDANYADVIERALLNTVLAGLARDGKHFFYVNPMEVWPEASEKNPTRQHVRPRRPGWYACACCPPNIARLLSSLGKYIYGIDEDVLYVHQYMNSEADFDIAGGVTLRQKTDYPWDGVIDIEVLGEGDFSVGLRIPDWCEKATIGVRGIEDVSMSGHKGYRFIERKWKRGDVIELRMEMPPVYMRANSKVRAVAGKVAAMRGPLVYCAEQTDNISPLNSYRVDRQGPLRTKYQFGYEWPGRRLVMLEAKGYEDRSRRETLYTRAYDYDIRDVTVRLIPYFLWGNRGIGEMNVWLRG